METFGVVAGALSTAALFNNCVDCFEYIQVGRHCDRDFRTLQIQLDCDRLRLTRWGAAVEINSSRSSTRGGNGNNDNDNELAKDILEQMFRLFVDAEKASKRYRTRQCSEESLRVYNANEDLDPTALTLHNQMRTTAEARQQRTKLSSKVAWALYEKNALTSLEHGIKGLVEELEILYPARERREQLADLEVGEINNVDSLLLLTEASKDRDELLESKARTRMATVEQGQKVGSLKFAGLAKVRIGEEWSVEAMKLKQTGFTSSHQAVDNAEASENAMVHIGPSYGMKSVFD